MESTCDLGPGMCAGTKSSHTIPRSKTPIQWQIADQAENGGSHLKYSQQNADRTLLQSLQKPTDVATTFGGFGKARTVNCENDCNRSLHPGLDSISTNDSNWGDSIYATAPGQVVSVGYMSSTNGNSAFGQYIILEHNVYEHKYYSVYSHLEKGSALVEVGDYVTAGTAIGGMGATANQSTVHLHYEIRRETAVDLNQSLPFVIPGNNDGNFFPDNNTTMRQYFVDLSSLDW